MKLLMFIVLLFLAGEVRGQDSSEVKYNEDKLAKAYPQWWSKIKLKRVSPNGWKYDSKEWELLIDGNPVQPKYYRDPKHGSNGGICYG